MGEPLLEVKDLRVNFILENKQVVSATEHVSFSIDKKSTLGIVGESGCGKSVTASSILGLLPKGSRLYRGRRNPVGRERYFQIHPQADDGYPRERNFHDFSGANDVAEPGL